MRRTGLFVQSTGSSNAFIFSFLVEKSFAFSVTNTCPENKLSEQNSTRKNAKCNILLGGERTTTVNGGNVTKILRPNSECIVINANYRALFSLVQNCTYSRAPLSIRKRDRGLWFTFPHCNKLLRETPQLGSLRLPRSSSREGASGADTADTLGAFLLRDLTPGKLCVFRTF